MLPVSDRVLVIGQLAGHRQGHGWFDAADVDALFEAFRVPNPASTSTTLGQLAKKKLTTRRVVTPRWGLTPEGESRVRVVLGDLDFRLIAARLESLPGAELGHVYHTVLPPSLAPAVWSRPIARLLSAHPFETNVLGMTRFPTDDPRDQALSDGIDAARTALQNHGLHLHLANDRNVDDELFGNVAAYMWACQFGLAFCEDRIKRGLNHNVMIELGSMTVTGRRCAILKDRTSPNLPTDLVGRIYKSVDLENLSELRDQIHLWAAADLALGRCGECPKPRKRPEAVDNADDV